MPIDGGAMDKMPATPTIWNAHLAVAAHQSPVEGHRSGFPLPGEDRFPGPPVMPNSLLRLDLWLSEFVADLREITNIIRNDIGLSVQVLRLAASEIEESKDKTLAISDIVVLVGPGKLKELAATSQPLSDNTRSYTASDTCERFWTHSRLTGLVAQELACRSSRVSAEQAYLAGLLSHLGDLPALLGWALPEREVDSRELGSQMAQAWRFPHDLIDVIGGDAERCRTSESRDLLEVVSDADVWASRLEFLAARESQWVRVKSPPYRLMRS